MTRDEYNRLTRDEQLLVALGEALEVIDQSDAVLQADGTWLENVREPLRGFGEPGADDDFR